MARIHLVGFDGCTLCTLWNRADINEHNVATGWPDCNECIAKSTEKPAEKPPWLT